MEVLDRVPADHAAESLAPAAAADALVEAVRVLADGPLAELVGP